MLDQSHVVGTKAEHWPQEPFSLKSTIETNISIPHGARLDLGNAHLVDIEEERAQGSVEVREVVLVHSRLQLDDRQVFVVL